MSQRRCVVATNKPRALYGNSNRLGYVAARYLEAQLQQVALFGVASSRSLSSLPDSMAVGHRPDLTVVDLLGCPPCGTAGQGPLTKRAMAGVVWRAERPTARYPRKGPAPTPPNSWLYGSMPLAGRSPHNLCTGPRPRATPPWALLWSGARWSSVPTATWRSWASGPCSALTGWDSTAPSPQGAGTDGRSGCHRTSMRPLPQGRWCTHGTGPWSVPAGQRG